MARKAPAKTTAAKPEPKVAPRPGKAKAVGAPLPTEPAAQGLARPAPEVIVVRSKRVACDGVGGALGHPRVYLEMGEADFVECGYCDRRFVLASGTEGPESEYAAPGVYEGSHGH